MGMSVISVVVTTLCKAHVGGICNLFCVVTLLQCKATLSGYKVTHLEMSPIV